MQCRAYSVDPRFPKIYDSNPLSPYHLQAPSIYIQKSRGDIPSSCVQDTQGVHIMKESGGDDPVLKLTATGVTFLGHYNEIEKKWEASGKFGKRYVGATACAVDRNGKLWLNAKELADEGKAEKKDKDKKKSARVPPDAQNLLKKKLTDGVSKDLSAPVPDAISQEIANVQNSEQGIEKILKKPREKCYKIDKARVRQRILAYLNTQKGKKRLFFWTVSFPEGTPDKTCYKAFNTWLTSLRYYGMLHEYLWIAERQMGERLTTDKAPTYTIHFHIAIPHYMDAPKANAMMRGTLKGYAKKGLLPGMVYNAKTKQTYYLPSISRYNGVHISKNKKTGKPINFAIKKGSRALANYLTKYVTKNDAGQKNDKGELLAPGFEHLAWHNSRGFTRLFTGVTCTLSEFTKGGFGIFLNRVRMFRMEFATFVPWLFGPPPLLMQHLFEVNSLIQNLTDNEQREKANARSAGANRALKKRVPKQK